MRKRNKPSFAPWSKLQELLEAEDHEFTAWYKQAEKEGYTLVQWMRLTLAKKSDKVIAAHLKRQWPLGVAR